MKILFDQRHAVSAAAAPASPPGGRRRRTGLVAIAERRTAGPCGGGRIGEQTRPHNDLDLVIPLDRVNDILVALAPLGYALADDQLPTRFVLREASGSQLDFHPVTFDREGGGTQALPGGESFRYPPESFSRGRIGGMEVPCISA